MFFNSFMLIRIYQFFMYRIFVIFEYSKVKYLKLLFFAHSDHYNHDDGY